MNKKFKAIIAGTMAIATATTMAFSASAYSANSSNINNVTIGSAGTNGGYTWHTEAIQSQYIELSKSFLSGGPKTITMAKTSGYNTQMVAMLDKSITSFEEAAGYVQNLTIKNAKGQTLLCKVERDSATGRFGIRSFGTTFNAIGDGYGFITKSVNTYNWNDTTKFEVKYTIEGLWIGKDIVIKADPLDRFKTTREDKYKKSEDEWFTTYTFTKERDLLYGLGVNETDTYEFTITKAEFPGQKPRWQRDFYKFNHVITKNYSSLSGYTFSDGSKVSSQDLSENKFVVCKRSGSNLYVHLGAGFKSSLNNNLEYLKSAYGYGIKRNGLMSGVSRVYFYVDATATTTSFYQGRLVGSCTPSSIN